MLVIQAWCLSYMGLKKAVREKKLNNNYMNCDCDCETCFNLIEKVEILENELLELGHLQSQMDQYEEVFRLIYEQLGTALEI